MKISAFKIRFSLLISALLSSCSQDPYTSVVQKINDAYLFNLPALESGAYACENAVLFKGKAFTKCGVMSLNGKYYPDLWELVVEGERWQALAVNGKALSRLIELKRFNQMPNAYDIVNFSEIEKPAPYDVAEILKLF